MCEGIRITEFIEACISSFSPALVARGRLKSLHRIHSSILSVNRIREKPNLDVPSNHHDLGMFLFTMQLAQLPVSKPNIRQI